jgi:thiamine biosynthesis lipoprotein
MGLPVRIVLHAADEQTARRAAAAAFDRIATLDRMMSDYRPDSEVRRIALRAGEAVSVSRELLTIVQHAVEIARLTGGAFDPTIAPLVALWRDARQTGRPPAPSALGIARSKVGWRRIELDPAVSTIRLSLPGMALDLGGIAKGYILQEALRTLRLHGVPRALIESGGDIVVGDAPPDRPGWTIEVARADAAFAERASRLTNVALASSGASAQFLEIDGVRYSHVIDPRTGLGVTSSRTARVIADDAATADALATALTVLETSAAGEVLSRFPGVMVSVVQTEESSRNPSSAENCQNCQNCQYCQNCQSRQTCHDCQRLPWQFCNPGIFGNLANSGNSGN